MDLSTVALVAAIAGVAGGAVAAALVGSVEGMFRQRQIAIGPGRSWRSYSIAQAVSAADEVRDAAPFDDFSDPTKRVLALAQDESQRFGHTYIGAEHLLLGVARDGDSVGARVLESLGLTLAKLRTATEATVPRGGGAPARPELSGTAKAVIRNARLEARALRHSHVGTEHLLLGVAREGSPAMSVLQSLGIAPERVRHEVIATIGRQPETVQARAAQPTDMLDLNAKGVLVIARQEAARSGHSYVGSENLAMALRLCQSSPGLVRIWQELAIDAGTLRQRIETAVPPTPTGTMPTTFTLTPRVTRSSAWRTPWPPSAVATRSRPSSS